jgi:GNAT superfamily N-acetyltransferase
MTTTLTIRKAEPSDLDVVEGVRAEAIAWLASKGLDQWQPNQPRVPTRASTVDAIDRGVCFAGTDIGGRLLDWAGDLAASAGRRWLRLDAWKGNTALHRYYERHGFTHVRTVDLWHRGSGSLFQRPTA